MRHPNPNRRPRDPEAHPGARSAHTLSVPGGGPGLGLPRRHLVERLLRGKAGEERIRVKGSDELLIYRAKCCNPIMGEPIVGYITRGKGVSVHSVHCPNVKNLVYDPERRIAVEWEAGAEGGYEVRLAVELARLDEARQMAREFLAIDQTFTLSAFRQWYPLREPELSAYIETLRQSGLPE